MVSESCISADDDGKLTGLYVNGQYLTGDITFVEGENISLSVTGNVVTVGFAADPLSGPSNTNQLIAALTADLGQPIQTINGVRPDAAGGFTRSSPDGTIGTEALDHGVALSSNAGDEAVDKETLSGPLENVQTLNAKAGRLEAFVSAIEANVNALQNELGFLKMSR